jgi:hypothetical protein
MPSISKRQKRFFQAVKRAKHDPKYGDERLRKVAGSMTDKDIDDFSKQIAELKMKKAVLSVLKDIVEPMYLNEDIGDEENSVDPIAKTFTVKEDWAKYIKPYIGQPLLPKESEALQGFKEKQPTTIARTEIWYNSTDEFGMSKTTVIKKMKDSGQFSFTAFQKQESQNPEEDKGEEGQESDMGMDNMNAGGPPESPQGQLPPGSPTPPTSSSSTEQDKTEKDDITVTKSILFKDEIKGASILIDFLKKLEL